MFKNVKYVDPKLYLPNGQPDTNKSLEPTDWKSFCCFIEDKKSIIGMERVNLVPGLVGYDNYMYPYETFTNTMEYYHNIQYNENNYVILDRISGEQSPVSRYNDYFTTIIKGYIYIDTSGTYSFSCRGDDCHAFCIDGKTFLFNSSTSNADGSIFLSAGYHPIEFYHREATGGNSYYLYWKKPGWQDWVLTENVFYHSSDMKDYGIISEDFMAQNMADLFELKTNVNGIMLSSDEAVKIDNVYGVLLSGYSNIFGSGDGKSISDASDFRSEQNGNGSVTFTSSSNFRTKFYVFKLKAGVTYTFSRSTGYNDQVWFYNPGGVYDNEWRDGTDSFTKTFQEDSICYLEVGGYNRDRYGWTTLNIYPIPDSASDVYSISNKRFLYHNQDDFSNSSSLVFGQSSFTHSIWYYKGNNIDGVIFSLEKNGDTISCLYLNNGQMNLRVGEQNYPIQYSFDNSFNKRGINSPVNIILSYDFDSEYMSVYIDGVSVLSVNVIIDTTFNEFLIGFSSIFSKTDKFLDGSVKWFRSFDRVLTQEEISSISSEFNHNSGDGSSWNIPLGRIPVQLDSDTAYIVRAYNDGTTTYINSGSSNITSMGLFNASLINEVYNILPEQVQNCPWSEESGRVILRTNSSDSVFSSSTLSMLYMYGVELMRMAAGTNQMFTFGISSNNSRFIIDKCKFFAYRCNLDDSNSDSFNENAGGYMRFTGTIGDFIFKNSVVVNTQIYRSDAFQIVNCSRAVIRNVDVYSTTGSSSQYNGFCFAFTRGDTGSSNNYFHDDFYNYTGNSSTNYIDIKNVNMKIRCSSNIYMPGLILSTSCERLRMENIDIETCNNISTPSGSPVCYNGIICIMGTYDYNVNNINLSMNESSKIMAWPLIMFFVTEPSLNFSYTQSAEQYHLIKNVNIEMGSNSSYSAIGYVNTESERTYYTTSEVRRYFNYYSAFGVYSDDDPLHSVHMVKDIRIYTPRCSAASLCGVGATFIEANGTIRVRGSNVYAENLTNDIGNCSINFWDNGEVNIDNLIVNNYNYGNLVNYNSSNGYLNTSVYVKNSNVPINNFNFNRSNGGNNNAFIYCQNTSVANGFYMRGMSQVITPVDLHRYNGHGVSLRLGSTGSQSSAFRFLLCRIKGLDIR